MSTDIKQVVKDKYGEAARGVTATKSEASCYGSSPSCCDPITSNLYDNAQTKDLPEMAVLASLGCGNPTALADLKPGEVVLDSARAAVSTCCSRPSGSGQRARRTAST